MKVITQWCPPLPGRHPHHSSSANARHTSADRFISPTITFQLGAQHATLGLDDKLLLELLKSVFHSLPHQDHHSAYRPAAMSTVALLHAESTGLRVVATYGTLALIDIVEQHRWRCAEILCPEYAELNSVLCIRDMTKDERMRHSVLVTASPWLRSYVCLRITTDTTLVVLYSGHRGTKRRWTTRASQLLRPLLPVLRSLLETARSQDCLDGPHAEPPPPPTVYTQNHIVLMVDPSARIMSASPAAAAYFARTSLVGVVLSELVVEADAAPLARLLGTAAGSALLRINHGIGHSDTSSPPPRVAIFFSDAQRRVTMVNVSDVTDTWNDELRRSEVHVQGKLLHQLAHELRNKFSAAIDVLEQVRGLIDNEPHATGPWQGGDLGADVNAASVLLREADHIISTRLFLSDVLRHEYVTRLNVRDVQVSHFLATMAAMARAQCPSDVQVSHTLCADAPPKLMLDHFVLSHVFTQLVNNSCKFTTTGQIELSLRDVSPSPEQNDDDSSARWATFSCYDTGGGIPAAARALLFDEQVLSCDDRGPGLGLASCGLFLRVIGGHIWIEATSSNHTEMRFRMPCHLFIDASDTLTTTTQVVDQPNPATFRVNEIYVVDDSALFRKLIARKLVSALNLQRFVDIREYETVEDALSAMRHSANGKTPGSCSIVCVDENLQSKGGKLVGSDLIAYLTHHKYEGLIVSVSGDVSANKRHLELGAHVILGKPFPTAEDLRTRLQNGLRQTNAKQMREDSS